MPSALESVLIVAGGGTIQPDPEAHGHPAFGWAQDIMKVVVCFSHGILGRFPVLHQFAGFATLFGFSAFISLSSSGVI